MEVTSYFSVASVSVARVPNALRTSPKFPEPMSPWFDNNEGSPQFVFRVRPQDSFEFLMHCMLGGGQNAKIDNPHS